MARYYVVVEWSLDESYIPAPYKPHLSVFGFFESKEEAEKYRQQVHRRFDDMLHVVVEVETPNAGLLVAGG